MNKVLSKIQNRQGDTLIVLTLLISVVTLFVATTLQRQTIATNRAVNRDFNSDASFYASDFAATAGYLVNKNNPTLMPGTTTLAIKKISEDDVVVGAQQVKKTDRDFGLGGGNRYGERPMAAKANAAAGLASLMEKYTGNNLSFTYKIDASTKAKSYCGKLTIDPTEKANSTCIVDVCVIDPSDMERKTFGGDPFTLINQVNARITEKKLATAPYRAPVIRSINASGGGFRWTSDGTIQQASLNKVCNLLGYREAVASTCLDSERSGRYPVGKCNFHSPGNNQLVTVDPQTGQPSIGPANPKYGHTWVSSLTCQGKMECP